VGFPAYRSSVQKPLFVQASAWITVIAIPAAMAEAQNGAQAERGRPHPWPIELSSCLGLSTVPLVDDAGTSVSYRNISGFAHRN